MTKLQVIISDIIYYTLFVMILCMLFGCSERYRYPCQDPNNWHKEECNNKVCDVEGTCTDKVIKK
jgi:hypothetical protein